MRVTALGEFPSSRVVAQAVLGPLALLHRPTHCRFISLLVFRETSFGGEVTQPPELRKRPALGNIWDVRRQNSLSPPSVSACAFPPQQRAASPP